MHSIKRTAGEKVAKLAALYAVSFKPTEISPRSKTCREAGGYAGCDIGSQFWNQGRAREIRDHVMHLD